MSSSTSACPTYDMINASARSGDGRPRCRMSSLTFDLDAASGVDGPLDRAELRRELVVVGVDVDLAAPRRSPARSSNSRPRRLRSAPCRYGCSPPLSRRRRSLSSSSRSSTPPPTPTSSMVLDPVLELSSSALMSLMALAMWPAVAIVSSLSGHGTGAPSRLHVA